MQHLFVSNFPYEATQYHFFQMFNSFDPVISAYLVKHGNYGFHKGYGFVTYMDGSLAVVIGAVKMFNKTKFWSQTLKVVLTKEYKAAISGISNVNHGRRPGFFGNYPMVPQTVQPLLPLMAGSVSRHYVGGAFGSEKCRNNSQLFFSSVSFETSERELLKKFERYGKVAGIHLVSHDESQHKGYGFMAYEDGKNARKALEGMKGQTIRGRKLKVEFSHSYKHTLSVTTARAAVATKPKDVADMSEPYEGEKEAPGVVVKEEIAESIDEVPESINSVVQEVKAELIAVDHEAPDVVAKEGQVAEPTE